MIHKRHHINPPVSIYKKIAISFVILTLLLIAVIFYFTLTYVYITVYPKAQDIATDFNFIIVGKQDLQKSAEGIFSGQIVNQFLSGEKKFDITGTMQLPGGLVGNVKITNNLSRNQTLIATTRLLTTDNILYRIKDRVDVPAKGSIVTAVYPDNPTKPLALAGTKFTIPGLNKNLQILITAEAVEDFKANGTVVKAISAEEMNKAVDDYTNELTQQLFKDEQKGMASVLTKEIVTKTFNQKVGDQVDNYNLSLKIKVVGVIFAEQPIKDYAQKILAGLVSADKQLVSVNTDNLEYKIERYDLANQLVQLKSNIKGSVIINEDNQILDRQNLAKLSFDQIKAYLENFDEIQKVEITSFPSFVKSLPYFQDHIIIKIVK